MYVWKVIMWQERKILIDGYNRNTWSRVELCEIIVHKYVVSRYLQTELGKPNFVKEVQNETEGNLLWSRLMAEKLELF